MKQKRVTPMLMQYAEPEYMCPNCGNKFYLYDSAPAKCEVCGSSFVWDDKE